MALDAYKCYIIYIYYVIALCKFAEAIWFQTKEMLRAMNFMSRKRKTYLHIFVRVNLLPVVFLLRLLHNHYHIISYYPFSILFLHYRCWFLHNDYKYDRRSLYLDFTRFHDRASSNQKKIKNSCFLQVLSNSLSPLEFLSIKILFLSLSSFSRHFLFLIVSNKIISEIFLFSIYLNYVKFSW